MTGLGGVIAAIGTIYVGIHNYDGSNGSKQLSAQLQANSHAPSIVGTYKWRDNFEHDFTIDFHPDGSAIQGNGNRGTWRKESSGSYTLDLESKYSIVGLTLSPDGSIIRGIEIAPDGTRFSVTGEKQ